MIRKIGSSLLPFAAIAFAACATIITGAPDDFRVTSDPFGARIYVDDEPRGVTPSVVGLGLGRHTVRVEMRGYKPYETTVRKGINGWFFGNILIGGVIGMIIDASTGAICVIEPSSVHAQLQRTGRWREMSQKRGENELFVAFTTKADPSWKKIGSLEPL